MLNIIYVKRENEAVPPYINNINNASILTVNINNNWSRNGYDEFFNSIPTNTDLIIASGDNAYYPMMVTVGLKLLINPTIISEKDIANKSEEAKELYVDYIDFIKGAQNKYENFALFTESNKEREQNFIDNFYAEHYFIDTIDNINEVIDKITTIIKNTKGYFID